MDDHEDNFQPSGGEPSINTNATEEISYSAAPAIAVCNACKSYYKGSPILKNYDMTVPAKSIYALLGSSGCGKTTILSCCVGLKKLDSGDLKIFGNNPGTSESGVPGRRVGFMPQEISLYEELTIEETLLFYGRVYGMTSDQIHNATEFLMDFLDLPKPHRKVGTLSGGQKRRASVATTLIHDPELLILDEPTVGVDPLLRESIWNYIVKLVSAGRTTVIVTTHYIDEARQANLIGIMRNGRLLTEASPDTLLKRYHTNNLEEVMLILCHRDEDHEDNDNHHAHDNHKRKHKHHKSSKYSRPEKDLEAELSQHWTPEEEDSEWSLETVELRHEPKLHHSKNKSLSPMDLKLKALEGPRKPDDANGYKRSGRHNDTHGAVMSMERVWALLLKEVLSMSRNLGFLAFIFLIPSLQVALSCLIVGSEVKDVKVAVVSKDGEDCHLISNYETCPFAPGRLPYHIKRIVRKESIVKKKFDDGELSGYVVFDKNFSQAIGCRFGIGVPDPLTPGCGVASTDRDIVEHSRIKVVVQMSEYHYGATIQKGIQNATAKLQRLIKETCSSVPMYEQRLARLGTFVKFDKKNLGKEYKGYVAVGMLLSLLYFFPLCSSSVAYISERRSGTLERMMVAGVTAAEFMGAFTITQLIILFIQTGIAFAILYCFGIEVKNGYDNGNLFLAILLGTMVGISGMAAGFAMAMLCKDEVQAILAAIGSFFPNTLASGILMPVAAAEWRGFEYLSIFVPCTLPSKALRAIIYEGQGIHSWNVIIGFLASLMWIHIYLLIAIMAHRYSSSNK